MTELFIAGQPVVLPEDFTLTIVSENPVYAKNGTYTYDLDLSLLNPQNARVYKHINRPNYKNAIPENRNAYLIVDNEVVLNGTEIILGWTNTSVKIQLASGNSELNFLIGGDKKLRDLDLGEAALYEKDPDDIGGWSKQSKILTDLYKTYPEVNYLPLPYVTGYDQDLFENISIKSSHWIGNNYVLKNIYWPDKNIPINPIAYPFYSGILSGQVMQPFLCFILERVMESLGYKVSFNSIADHPILKGLYIVHGYRTTKFAKMLPDWTVNEFIGQVEKWLDCSFIVNQFDRNVRILFNYQTDLNASQVDIDVLDEYTAELDSENRESLLISNVEYNLDSNEYSDFMCLSPFVRNKAKLESSSQTLEEFIAKLSGTPDWKTDAAFGTIYRFHLPRDDRFMIYDRTGKGNDYTLKKIDSFRPMMNNPESEETDISLNIIPASMRSTYIEMEYAQNSYWIQYPVTEDYDDLTYNSQNEEDAKEEAYINLQEVIGSESTEPEKGSGIMRLAIYLGMKNELEQRHIKDERITRAYFPISAVESLSESFVETKKEYYYLPVGAEPFRFDYLMKQIYERNSRVNSTKIYKLTFMNIQNPDTMAVYVGNNKKYRCSKIERTVTQKGFDKLAKGEFYPYE